MEAVCSIGIVVAFFGSIVILAFIICWIGTLCENYHTKQLKTVYNNHPELKERMLDYITAIHMHNQFWFNNISFLEQQETDLRNKLPTATVSEHAMYSIKIDELSAKIKDLKEQNDTKNNYKLIKTKVAELVATLTEKEQNIVNKYEPYWPA